MPQLPRAAGAPADSAAAALQRGRLVCKRLRAQEQRACVRVCTGRCKGPSGEGGKLDSSGRFHVLGSPGELARVKFVYTNYIYDEFDVLRLEGFPQSLRLPDYAVAAVRSGWTTLAFFGRRRNTAVTPSEKFCVKISTMWI